MIELLTKHVAGGGHLDHGKVLEAVDVLAGPDVPPEAKADFLTALHAKGETPEEIALFANILRDRAIPLPLSSELRNGVILDVCGTGGDRLNTFNISTTVALVVAAAGVPVAKHGNRAITSQSGSADLLEALGVPITLPPAEAAASLATNHFAFLFAQAYHPAFKNIGPARVICAARGQRTLFNFLGPLINPARPTAQLMGVSRRELLEPMAHVLRQLGVQRAMIVCGRAGDAALDEFSTLGETTIAEFYHERALSVSTFHPSDIGLATASLQDLHGGDKFENAAITLAILSGQDRGPKRDAVLLNAGAAIFTAGGAKSMIEGMELAGRAIDTGAAAKTLAALSNT